MNERKGLLKAQASRKRDINYVLKECLKDCLQSYESGSRWKQELKILLHIACNGTSTEYALTKSVRAMSRKEIRNRIRDLISNEFLLIAHKHGFRNTGKKVKYLGLTIKGLLAVLTDIEFEDTYLYGRYETELLRRTKDKSLLEPIRQYIKNSIALLAKYCSDSGIDLFTHKASFVESLGRNILVYLSAQNLSERGLRELRIECLNWRSVCSFLLHEDGRDNIISDLVWQWSNCLVSSQDQNLMNQTIQQIKQENDLRAPDISHSLEADNYSARKKAIEYVKENFKLNPKQEHYLSDDIEDTIKACTSLVNSG